jgi:trk system potassium uptake protein TrkA
MRIFIAGGGHCGEFIARRLIREGNDVYIVEQDEERCRYLEAHLDAQTIQCSATRINTWRRVGITNEDMLIAATHQDEVNVLATLIVDAAAPDARKLLRLRTPEYNDWSRMLEQRGIRVDRVIHPEIDIVERINRVLTVPGVTDIRDFAEGRVKVFSMNVESDSQLAHCSLSELEEQNPPNNIMICMIFRDEDVIIPHGELVLEPGDHIYIVTTADELDDCLRFMGIRKHDEVRQVFIVGAGGVGIAMADMLENEGVSVKLFEKDPHQSALVSRMLRNTVVINADGTDQDVLLQENVEGIDAFIALTKNDDANIIISLLARKAGAKKLVALVNHMNYISLAQRLGINTTVSPRIKSVDAILEFIRKGGVLSVRTLGEEMAEAIELVAPPESQYVGRPLREIGFPRGVIVGAIASPEGEVLVPRGDAVIEPGDRVIFFALESCVAELEAAFLTKSRRLKLIRW